MKILVDADACPNPIKAILFKVAAKRHIHLILFANHPLTIPGSPWIRFIQVPKGFDVADLEIVNTVEPNDIVITADIPLASLVIEKGAFALNPRGTLYTKNNIQEKLGMRNFMEELRGTGQHTGGPAPFDQKTKQYFANALDRLLHKKS